MDKGAGDILVPGISYAFPPSHLAIWGDKGEPVQREVGVPCNSLGEVGKEEGNRTHGEKWFACYPSPIFLFLQMPS